MTTKSILRLTALCLLVLAVGALTTCASGGGKTSQTAQTGERGLTVEEPEMTDTSMEVFPQLGQTFSDYVFSPDGKYVLGARDSLKLWDVASGREIISSFDYSGSVQSIVFSPDGKTIAVGIHDGSIRLGEGAKNVIKLFDVFTGRVIQTFGAPFSIETQNNGRHNTGTINSLAFSPDGKYIVSGNQYDPVKLWNVSTGRLVRTFTRLTGDVVSVSYSPDGKTIIASSNYAGKAGVNTYMKIWDAVTGYEIRAFPSIKGVNSVSFSPDGKYFASISGTATLWDATTGTEIMEFSDPSHSNTQVNSVAFSPDGKIFAYILGGMSKTLKLWDIAARREIETLPNWNNRSGFISYSPDGKYLACIEDGTFKLCDASTGTLIRTFEKSARGVGSVYYSPDGKFFASSSSKSTSFGIMVYDLTLWDVVSGQRIRTFPSIGNTGIIMFSPDWKTFISCGLGYMKLWDVATGQEIRTFSLTSRGPFSWYIFNSVEFSSDGKQILSGSSDNMVKLWDIATGREIRTFSHSDKVVSVTFSPDRTQIASASDDKTVKLWNVATGKEIRTFNHPEKVVSVAFSPDGKTIVSHSNLSGRTVKLWDIATGRETKVFDPDFGSVGGGTANFSHDGKHIVWWLESAVYIWNTESEQLQKVYLPYIVSFVVLSPDGTTFASKASGENFKLWDITTGREIRTFSHSDNVVSVAFSPDGTQITSASHDGTTRLWDIATGNEIASFISFSGNDTQLASATRGLTVETQTTSVSNDGEWLSITPDGFYQASPRGDRYLNVRVGNTVSGIDSYRSVFYNPDVVQARLQGRPDPVTKSTVTIQQAANFLPPKVTIQSPANFSTTNTATANLSVNIVDQNQPLQNIKILVNGRLIGRNELAAIKGNGLQAQKASLTVTGNLKTVTFSLPITLDPGRNIIEVVAFNGYSESPRIPIEITWNAPANQKPTLPNLWILAVGVNNYQDTNINNLNYCVADAKGVVDSLKAQEGKRYAKVNSLIIADGETLVPTATNIRQSLNFLDQAGERDVVLLFLAGHGVSEKGKFFFLPTDTRLNANKTVNESTGISDADIVKVLDRAGNLLVFIDACQSGGVDNDRLVRSLMDTNAFVFASSRGNELSQEKPELGHGVFTYSVMEGLKGAVAAQAQGNVTVLSLSGFVSNDVPKRTNGAQNPKAYSLGFYDFPMAVVK